MYTYPNDLRCAASVRRIEWFERTVPFITSAALLIGTFFICNFFLKDGLTLLTFNAAAWTSVVWWILVALVHVKIFDIWCKAIKD